MLSYAESLSTPQIHWPRPGPTISPSGSSPESAPPWHRVHIWGDRPPFLLWSSSASSCTFQWDEFLQRPLPTPPGNIPTRHLPHVLPSSLWSALPSSDGILPRPLAYPLSPPISYFRTGSPTNPPPCTSSPGPALFLQSSPSPSQLFPTASAPSTGSGTPPPNCCYYIWLSARGTVMPPTVAGNSYWSGMRPHFPWSSVVGSRVGVAFPLPAYISQRHNTGFSASLLGIGSHIARS